MSVLPEKGMSLDDLQAELDEIRNRCRKYDIDPTRLMVVVQTHGQLLPHMQYGFAVEEVEDAFGQLRHIQLLADF